MDSDGLTDPGRRAFLTEVAGLAAAGIGSPGGLLNDAWPAESPDAQPPATAIPAIDTHIHLFDPTRPQGAPYSGAPGTGPPQPALPPRYRALAAPLGIVGDGVAPIDKIVGVVREYFASQPRAVVEKHFSKNSIAAYKWIRRDKSQPVAN